ncbi:hypothetical protein CFIO01_05830 [Colletotrichum fioriniae PJ7]|uniref:Calcineurin-like phosphoesterase domain-containing protein n=1 Tax=Colletotrichum fioriniae PJ7 TaxID=1445577 RepID=A0A010R8I1_9PEZI|nr:hypothetical protein CFIO01_05830 [Colletotrichum fioriniae PJ7]
MAPSDIRFLVLSDTHDSAFPSELPPADVVLHCGDLTMIGGMSNYKAAIKSLSSCDAQLKLVIPGNHDVSLDPTWWANNANEGDDLKEPKKAIDLFNQSGVNLLSEGYHSFTLKDGRSFTLYASPYTPEFNGYAFSYGPHEDRFNPAETTLSDLGKNVVRGPKPLSSEVDILITHGPPQVPCEDYRLDLDGKGVNCGCSKLWQAVQRIRPRIHCFGHLHEGYGSQVIEWRTNGTQTVADPVIKEGNIIKAPEREARKTLLVNAAVMNHHGPNNKPWLVDY